MEFARRGHFPNPVSEASIGYQRRKEMHSRLRRGRCPHHRRPIGCSAFRAKPAHQKDDEAYQQNESDPASANGGAPKIKAAAAEQEKEHDHKE